MSLILQSSGGGQITVQEPATASNFTQTLPAASGEVVLAGTTPTFNGITFPATQVPSADANTLDDYEEGTWTPSVTFTGASTGITYNSRSGSYIKVGQFIYASFNIVLTNKGSSGGNSGVAGLPFTSGGGVTYPMAACNTFNLNATAQTMLQITTGGTVMEIKFSGLDTNPNDTNFTNSTQIRAAFVYQAQA